MKNMKQSLRAATLRALVCSVAMLMPVVCAEICAEDRVPAGAAECASDADCTASAWDLCLNGRCYETGVSACNDGSDCDSRDFCYGGVCRSSYCYPDREETCGKGWNCMDRTCVPPSGCPGSEWCDPGYICVDYKCVASGTF